MWNSIRTLSVTVFGISYATALGSVLAQEAPLIKPGTTAVTGFSETFIPNFEEGLLPGVDAVDETFINPETATLRLFDLNALGGRVRGQLVNAPPPFEVKASQIGQVFGLAYDDGKREDTQELIPNVYATASSLHGIQIVEDDNDEDGRPERLRRGKDTARFMRGQFGSTPESGPGSIWKLDGRTGEVSLFANIEGNSGAGLGNIAFDKANRQFFVTDVDTGLIQPLSIDVTLDETFDHGEGGRPLSGLDPISDDGAVMDIKGGAFDSEDPETWGYTQVERRVWGVAVHRNRVYYTVEDKLQVWSVGLGYEGELLGDARWELDVTADRDYAVTDITFDRRGFMYLAQRGPIENRYDYTRFAKSGKGEVLRYYKEVPNDPATPSVWIETPQSYAVGFPTGHQQTAGGIDLQYKYDVEGFIDYKTCDGTVVKTGDNLRDNPDFVDRLGPDGSLVVHGLQLTKSDLTRPANQPPFGSWFVDNDNLFEDPEVRGHIGDVEVFRPCDGKRYRAGGGWIGTGGGSYPDPGPDPKYPKSACLEIKRVSYECAADGTLISDIYLTERTKLGGDTLKVKTPVPGISISPAMQKRASAAHPFSIFMNGVLPGEDVPLNLCFFKSSDAEKGGYFPCCKVNLTLPTSVDACVEAR